MSLIKIYTEIVNMSCGEYKSEDSYDPPYAFNSFIKRYLEKTRNERYTPEGKIINPYNGKSYWGWEIKTSKDAYYMERAVKMAILHYLDEEKAEIEFNPLNNVFEFMLYNQKNADIKIGLISTEYELKAIDKYIRNKRVDGVKVPRGRSQYYKQNFTPTHIKDKVFKRFEWDKYDNHYALFLFDSVLGKKSTELLESNNVDYGSLEIETYELDPHKFIWLYGESERVQKQIRKWVFDNIVLPNVKIFYEAGALNYENFSREERNLIESCIYTYYIYNEEKKTEIEEGTQSVLSLDPVSSTSLCDCIGVCDYTITDICDSIPYYDCDYVSTVDKYENLIRLYTYHMYIDYMTVPTNHHQVAKFNYTPDVG